jgi:hypothetical protein
MSDRDLTLTLGQIVEFADEIAALLATRTRSATSVSEARQAEILGGSSAPSLDAK